MRARPVLLDPLLADRDRGLRSGSGLEVLERAVVVRGRDAHTRPTLFGPALLLDHTFGRPAQLAVAIGREGPAEEDDLLGLELAPAAEAARGERDAIAAGGWRTWHSG